MARSRSRVRWWEFSARLFRYPAAPVLDAGQDLPFRRAVGAELVGDQHPWHVLLGGQQLAQEPAGRVGVATTGDQHPQGDAALVDGPPQVPPLTFDRHDQFVEMPLVPGPGPAPTELVGVDRAE